MANCPRCGGSLNGYVELGSEGYKRVKSGCCPNCGAGMPANMNVGFAEKFDPNPRVHGSVVADSVEKGRKYRYWSLYFPLLGGVGIFLMGFAWWMTLIGVVLALFTSFFLWAYYSGLGDCMYVPREYRQSDIRNLTVFWVISVISVILFCIGIMVAVDKGGNSMFYWLFSILANFIVSAIINVILTKYFC